MIPHGIKSKVRSARLEKGKNKEKKKNKVRIKFTYTVWDSYICQRWDTDFKALFSCGQCKEILSVQNIKTNMAHVRSIVTTVLTPERNCSPTPTQKTLCDIMNHHLNSILRLNTGWIP